MSATHLSDTHKTHNYLVGGGHMFCYINTIEGGGPRVVVSTAAFHARVPGSVPGLGGLKQKCFFPIHVWKSVLWGASLTER